MYTRLYLAIAAATCVVAVIGVFLLNPSKGELNPFKGETPEAQKIMSTAMEIAAFADIANLESVATQFDLVLRRGVHNSRPTRCAGRPVQESQTYQTDPKTATWFRAGATTGNDEDSRKKGAPVFLLELEQLPLACVSDGISYTAMASFWRVSEWHCVRPGDLGSLARDFVVARSAATGRSLRRTVDRTDGKKAQIEVNFSGAEPASLCLQNMIVRIT